MAKPTKPTAPDDPLKTLLAKLAACDDPLIAEWAKRFSRPRRPRRGPPQKGGGK
jgi:hypothetical protein